MVAYSSDNGEPLTSTQIESVSTYLRSLEPNAVANPQWQKPLADADLTGEELFSLACARCHGVDRLGIEDSASISVKRHLPWMRMTSGWPVV